MRAATLRTITTPPTPKVASVKCNGKKHRIIVRGGKVHFVHHRLADLRFLIALDSHCTCADVLHALRTPAAREHLTSLLPPTLLAPLVPYVFPENPHPSLHLPSWPEQCQELLAAAIDHHFAQLLQTLKEQGLTLSIIPRTKDSLADHAITLHAQNIPLGYFANSAWHLSARQVAKMARATTPRGTPHPSWGDEKCRTCSQALATPVSSFTDIEEIPGPRPRPQTIFQHANSQPHLRNIRSILEDVFGPESFFPPSSQ